MRFRLGNDRLSMLTNQDLYQLRIDLKGFAHYYSVRVANEVDKYRLTIGSYLKGDAGDSLSFIMELGGIMHARCQT
jgi:hypothetical protein